jgi:riboflavin synthase alpha subunit
MINKGSVAVDGVSLTINQCDANGFQVAIIPHTGQVTTRRAKWSSWWTTKIAKTKAI